MEKEKNNKGVVVSLIIVIIILLVLCILFATNIISFSKQESSTNNQTNNGTEIVENSTEEDTPYVVEAYNKEISYKFPEDIQGMDSSEKKAILHRHIVLPKITINTKNAKAFNKKILETYQEDINNINNISKLDAFEKTYSKYINYTYVVNDNIIYILIEYQNHAYRATGGTFHKSYIYDIKADKELSVQDILKKYGITKKAINDEIQSMNKSGSYIEDINDLNEVSGIDMFDNIYLYVYIENTIDTGVLSFSIN